MLSIKTTLPKFLFWLLLLIALLNCAKLLRSGFQPDNPSDFRTLYLGQKLLSQGENPYSDRKLKLSWQQTVIKEKLESDLAPGFPETPLVYPPWALVLFMPFSLLSYQAAYICWYLVLPFLLYGILIEVQKFNRRFLNTEVTLVDLLVLTLAFKSTIPALIVGQPLFLCLWLGFIALNLSKTHNLISGILLGLAAFKITLALPFLIFMLFRKEWKILIIAGTTGLLLISIAFLLVPESGEMLRSYNQTIVQLRQQVFTVSGTELPYFMPLLTEIGVALVYLAPKIYPYLTGVYLLIMAGSFYWYKSKVQKNTQISGFEFLIIALVTLLSTYHLLYDCLILLPLGALILKQNSRQKILAAVICSVFFLPVNGILDAILLPAQLNILYFSTPFALLVLLIWLLLKADLKPAINN